MEGRRIRGFGRSSFFTSESDKSFTNPLTFPFSRAVSTVEKSSVFDTDSTFFHHHLSLLSAPPVISPPALHPTCQTTQEQREDDDEGEAQGV